jgi:hypothetical protein
MPSCLKLLHLKLRPTDTSHYIIIVIARIILGADFHLRACHYYFLWLQNNSLETHSPFLCLMGLEGEINYSHMYRNSLLMSSLRQSNGSRKFLTHNEEILQLISIANNYL